MPTNLRHPFSRRFQWDTPENLLTRRLAELRASGRDLIDLTLSNPTQANLNYALVQEACRALGQEAALHYEPAPRGLRSAREAVAERYWQAWQVRVSPEDVVLTCSTSEAYTFLFRLLADPGDQVLVPRPSYPLFDYLARMQDLEAVSYQLSYDQRDGWRLDRESVRGALGERVRALLVVSPNNPTGSLLRCDDLQWLRGLGVPLIVDEVFGAYVLAAKESPVTTCAAEQDAPCFVLNGLSKLCALPQMKLSWIVVAGPPAFRDRARQGLEMLGDTFLSVGTPVQLAAPQLLDAGWHEMVPQIVQRLLANLGTLPPATPLGVAEVLPIEGGWYGVLRLPPEVTDEDWALRALEQAGVLFHPGYLFDFAEEAYLVYSLLVPEQPFRQAIERVARCFSSPG